MAGQLAFLLTHVFLSVIGLYIFIFNYQLSENILTQNASDKQSIIAKSGARSVENFIKDIQNQLYSFVFSFTKVDENSSIDKNVTRKEFDSYIQRTSAPISGIALYDENGKLLIIENKQKITAGENEDFSDYAFIQWSKDSQSRGKTFITNPYIARAGASKGKIIMVVATPVYFGNKHKGTLAIRFLVGQFKNAFIDPLSSEIDENSFIIGNDGVMVAGEDKLLNQNLSEYAKEMKWTNYDDFINKLNLIVKKDQTKTAWYFKYPNDKAKNFIVASSKIDIPNTDKDLFLIVTIPAQGTTKALRPLRYYGSLWVGISVLLTFFSGLLYIVIRQLSRTQT